MQIQPCHFVGEAPTGAPRLRLVEGLDVVDRDRARLQARAVLRSCLTAELGCAEAELEISNLRNQPPQLRMHGQLLETLHCSISHAPGLALLAWHRGAAVGVDIQAVDGHMPRAELEAVAWLFLQPKVAQALSGFAENALFLEAFAQAWARQEAQLKCAGLGLMEWSAGLQARLTGMSCASLLLAQGHAAAVAWWPATDKEPVRRG
ncbi:MAG: hypothetical protein LBE30_16640 [Comamonas sp.]|nr:hypothetical protein [Comamonas sp.]